MPWPKPKGAYNPKLEQIVDFNLKRSGGKQGMSNRYKPLSGEPESKVSYLSAEQSVKKAMRGSKDA